MHSTHTTSLTALFHVEPGCPHPIPLILLLSLSLFWDERAKRMMVRWMCGVTLKDRKTNEELLGRLGIECVFDMVRRGRLRCFGHNESKTKDDWVAACRDMVVEGGKGRGRRRKTWHECIVEDMRKLKLQKEDAQNQVIWRRGIYGKQSNVR